jgi:protein O-GlcNAc transferase
VVQLWAQVLRALPAARLVLSSSALGDPATAARYRGLFAGQAIAADRVDLLGGVPHIELLAQYGEVDVALDPFPYSGGLTTCEALWMGVPVVTWTGETFPGRHSTSHLSNVGLAELVTDSPLRYVETAVQLGNDRDRLVRLRSGLRGRMAASPLCDGPRFTRHLEEAYRRMWQRWCARAGATARR